MWAFWNISRNDIINRIFLKSVVQGAMVLDGKPAMRHQRVALAAYGSHTAELPFYFPYPGAPLLHVCIRSQGRQHQTMQIESVTTIA